MSTIDPHVSLAVLSRRSDDRLRAALGQLDVLATDRLAHAGDEVGRVAAAVVAHTASRAAEQARRTMHANAWLAIGVAVGIGMLVAHASSRR